MKIDRIIPKLNKRTVHIASILIIAVLLFTANLIVTVLTWNYPILTFDLTRGKIFKLAPETIKNIGALEGDITIYVLAREETFTETSVYNAQANEVIRQYEKNSGAIRVVYVDYVKDPTFASAFPDLLMKHGDILVSCGEKYSLVKTEDLFNYAAGASGNLSIVSSRAEEALYTAILRVTSDRAVEVTVITGHAEYTMKDFSELLEKNNYVLRSVNLAAGEIAPLTDLVLIIAPKFDYSEEELGKLDDFLINDGNYGKTILYCADAEQPELPAIATFLREWGVGVEDGAVFETNEQRVYNYHPFYAVADYAEETYAGLLKNIAKPMLMPISRPLAVLFEYRNNYSVKTLLEFAASAGVRPSGAPPDFTADDAVRRGPIPALVLCDYSVLDRETGRSAMASHLLVSGSAGMLDAYGVNNPSFSNAEYLVNILNVLSGRDDILPFRPKSFAGNNLNLSRTTVNVLGTILILVIPLIILAAGLVVWIRRIRS
jgi:hypothetical protein